MIYKNSTHNVKIPKFEEINLNPYDTFTTFNIKGEYRLIRNLIYREISKKLSKDLKDYFLSEIPSK